MWRRLACEWLRCIIEERGEDGDEGDEVDAEESSGEDFCICRIGGSSLSGCGGAW